ncbi:hypothetical protein ACWIGW_01980 [Nocardia brasiliensis]
MLELLRDPHRMYMGASDKVRRRLNQAIFKQIYVFNEEVTVLQLRRNRKQAMYRMPRVRTGSGKPPKAL